MRHPISSAILPLADREVRTDSNSNRPDTCHQNRHSLANESAGNSRAEIGFTNI